MNIHSFKNARLFHKWTGFVCAAFFLILAVSGVLLMHYESLDLNGKSVSGWFIPDKYFQVTRPHETIQALASGPGSPFPLFAGTAHGLYRSTDAGSTWIELKEGLFNLDIRVLAVSPHQPGTVYAGTAAGIFRSLDGGDTWPEWFDEASGLSPSTVNDLALDPENPERMYAATPGGLFLSTDAGDTWSPIFQGTGYEENQKVRQVRISPTSPAFLYITTERGTFRSEDAGKTWNEVWQELGPKIQGLVLLNTDPQFIYAGTPDGLYKSFNQGQTWIRDKMKDLDDVEAISVHPQRITRLYVTSGAGLFYSSTGGDQWSPVTLNLEGEKTESRGQIHQIIQTRGSDPVIVLATDGGLILSADAGRTWRSPNLQASANTLEEKERKIDLVKLITEIHTGRFFGSYFVLFVDLATGGLVLLVITGAALSIYRRQVRQRKKDLIQKELGTEVLLEIQETADDLSLETNEVHHMIEHIGRHLEKCKTIYMTREKKEIEEIGRHITTLDKKMHHLMQRIGEFEKISQN